MNKASSQPRESLAQWLSWLESLHPKEIELGLARIKSVAERLDLLSFDTPVVTVAGTNGKGSCIALLEAIYVDAGYRVGAYTSPHLLEYNERIRFNAKPVSDAELLAAFEAIDVARDNVSLTYFEFGTLAALFLFKNCQHADKKLDLILLEVGLGGRLDAVNIIDADVVLITSIDLDHEEWLGEDREQIGFEKAGIMRSGQYVVIGDPDVPKSVLSHADSLHIEPYVQGKEFSAIVKDQDGFWDWRGKDAHRQALTVSRLPKGGLQLVNLASVMQVCQLLSLSIKKESLVKGMLTKVAGRQECINSCPQLVFDVAHNVQAVSALALYLEKHPVDGKTLALFGVLDDKNVQDMISVIQPHVNEWIVTDLPVHRSCSKDTLVQIIADSGESLIQASASPVEAFEKALATCGENDRIVVFGSFYTVSEVKRVMMAYN